MSTVALLSPAPAGAADATGRCSVSDVRVLSDNPASDHVQFTGAQFIVSAHIYGGSPQATYTYIKCELRPLDPNHAPGWIEEQGTRGPVGVFYAELAFDDSPQNIDWYVCTTVRTAPATVTTNYGCNYAFTY
jgi:hypothetical protein